MIIPSKDRKEWRMLLTDDLNFSLKNYFFQMKVTQARNQILKGSTTIDIAVNEIHALCSKFNTANNLLNDLESIFGLNYVEKFAKEKETERKKELEKKKNLQKKTAEIKIDFEKKSTPKKAIQSTKKEVKELMSTFKAEKKLVICKETMDEKEFQLLEQKKQIDSLTKENKSLQKKNQELSNLIIKLEKKNNSNTEIKDDKSGVFSKLFKKP